MSGQSSVCVITGGVGAMGLACARAMGGMGLILLADIDENRVHDIGAELAAAGYEIETAVCDVSIDADVKALAELAASLGTFRSLVHTAGISPTMADGRRVLEVDLIGTARVISAFQPLVAAGTAAVCVGSIAGYSDIAVEIDSLLDDPLRPGLINEVTTRMGEALDADTAYALAKRGVMRLCERNAADWGAAGGRILSISPGLIDTPMGRRELDQQEIMKLMVDFTPVKRPGMVPLPGRPSDIAATVAFLCSDAAGFISGCDVRIDGGLVGAGRHMEGIQQ
jgi:NAD(P)-dependent dehydrogenase (short-subunit alcohol dehydrogenase family)